MKEIRYILEVTDFDKIPSKFKIDYREDWYFKDYRIRHSYSEPKRTINGWFKILNKESSKSNKKKIPINPPSKETIKEFNGKAIFHIKVYSKEWTQDNQDFYLEKVEIYVKSKLIKLFYTTEAENENDLKMIKQLSELPFIKKVKKLGNISLKDICLRFISKYYQNNF